jgi:YVTN family beta-propeller protein
MKLLGMLARSDARSGILMNLVGRLLSGFCVATMIGAASAGSAHALEGSGKPLAYIGTDSGDVVALDTANNRITATIKVANGSGGVGQVAVAPDLATVYATNPSASTVVVIDTATRKIIHTVKVGENPLGVAVSPNGGEIYVADAADAKVPVVATKTRKVVATITMPGGDLAKTFKVVRTVKVGKLPDGVAVNRGGTAAYVTNECSNSISIIDTATDKVVKSVAISGNPSSIVIP